MSTVTSPDGTVIDYDRYGDGPAVIFIGGATAYRAIDERTTQTARRLAAGGYTAIDYDLPWHARGRRRGGRRAAERQPPHPARARSPAGTRSDGAGAAGVPQILT